MGALPPDLVAYSRSPEFDQDTLPAALQRNHSTKAGTWALIHVLEGKLLYRVMEPASETVLEPGTPGVVKPAELHEVHPLGEVRMFVEFYRENSTDRT
ncbi:DUF1971 domain-containing protein [Tianweitania sp.]|uniref:DUF1971 domain-containing protein n=1 Tax=Tianweitania sp. TaxID=2021634 RepID=UPI0028993475|nr:DUF1971 domain-containing protein [Tianweitania sp.]